MSEVATRDDLAEVRSELNGQLAGVRSDIKDLTQALRDLIRLDGDIKRMQEAQGRIGREVEDHEKRLRVLETGHATHGKSVGRFEKLIDASLLLLLGGLIGMVLSKGGF